MDIHSLPHEDRKQWDEFVLITCQGSLFHTIGWKRILEKTFAYDFVFFAAYDKGQICGILPIFVVPKPLKGHVMVSVPFGVYGGVVAERSEAAQALLSAAKNLTVEKGVDSLEFRQMEKLDDALPTKDLYVTFVREIFDGEEKTCPPCLGSSDG